MSRIAAPVQRTRRMPRPRKIFDPGVDGAGSAIHAAAGPNDTNGASMTTSAADGGAGGVTEAADAQASGIKLEHGGVGDPRIGQEPRAGAAGVEEQQRGTAGDPGKAENVLAAYLLFAGKRDLGDAEACAVRRAVADVLHRGGDFAAMAAFHRAVAAAGEDERDRRGGSGAAR